MMSRVGLKSMREMSQFPGRLPQQVTVGSQGAMLETEYARQKDQC